MPDISKCNNVTCSLRTKCYRFTSEDSLWQSYTNFEQNEDSTCDYFYDYNSKGEAYVPKEERSHRS